MNAVADLLGLRRLVTLTGAGGSGKTRLALAVAERVRTRHKDGIVFVDLSPLRDADRVPAAILGALGLRESEGMPAAERLGDLLRDREMLLVLDNAEQVIEAAPLLSALLEAADRVTALVTSRRPLRVRGEREYHVEPLACPDPARFIGIEEMAAMPAVALFVERAGDVSPGFALTTANADAVARICRRLDGLPLAIELAAASARALTPHAILERLDGRLSLAGDGPRDAPARQRTVRDAIAWSYALLGPTERALFRRLGVFAGGWSVESAEAVCADAAPATLLGIAALVEQSLVRPSVGVDGLPRFTMLETVRAFARDELAERGEAGAVAGRHAAYIARLLACRREALSGGVGVALDAIEAEQDNLRAALDWCVTEGDVGLGCEIVRSMRPYWRRRGDLGEGDAWAERLLAIPTAHHAGRVHAWLTFVAGDLAAAHGRFDPGLAWLEESVAIWRALDDPDELANVLDTYGGLLVGRDPDRARVLLEECVAIARAGRDGQWHACALAHLGQLASLQGDQAGAEALYERSLAVARARAVPVQLLAPLAALASLAALRGDQIGARERVAEVLATLERVEPSLITVDTLSRMAVVLQRLGDDAGAAALLTRGLMLSVDLHTDGFTTGALAIAAGLAERRGKPAHAVRLYAVWEAFRERHRLPAPPTLIRRYERSIRALRETLGEATFIAAWESGQALPLRAAADEALALLAAMHESPTPDRSAASPAGLSAREAEVLHLLARGHRNREIAERLVLSVRTVEDHLSTIYAKLGVRGRLEAARHADAHELG